MTVAQAKPSGRNVYLDLFKFFLCYMVICIHLVQTKYPIYPLYRLSVPMFFLISGYFLYTPDPDKAKGRAPGFIRRCATYMAVGIAIHTVYEVIAYLVDGTSVGWLLTTLFYDDPSLFWFRFFFENAPIPYYTVGAQMWFLIALFTVSLVHYLLARSGKLWWYKWIVPVCFVCYFFFTAGVYFFQPETSVQMRYMRNAWFFGLPCFGLGYLLAGIKWPRTRLAQIIYGVLGVGFFALQMVEDSLWRTPNCKIEIVRQRCHRRRVPAPVLPLHPPRRVRLLLQVDRQIRALLRLHTPHGGGGDAFAVRGDGESVSEIPCGVRDLLCDLRGGIPRADGGQAPPRKEKTA